VKMFDVGRTRMIGLPYGEKNCDNMLSRSYPIPERHGRTDRRTDIISRVSVLTRDTDHDFRPISRFGIDERWSVECCQQI